MRRPFSVMILVGGALMILGPVLNLVQGEHLAPSGMVVLSLGVVIALVALIDLVRYSRRAEG